MQAKLGYSFQDPSLLERALGTRVRLEVRPRARVRFTVWTESDVESVSDVAEVLAILERVGAQEFTRARARAYRDEALSEIGRVGTVDDASVERLHEIVEAAIPEEPIGSASYWRSLRGSLVDALAAQRRVVVFRNAELRLHGRVYPVKARRLVGELIGGR